MDIKEQYAREADDIAWERYDMEFYSLAPDVQYKVYEEAMASVMDRLICSAEAAREAQAWRAHE